MRTTKTKGLLRLQSAGRATILVLLAITGLQANVALAEPYLAIQEGYKCSKCHVNMTGGGKRTDFANIYVQTRLSSNFLNWRDYLPALGEDEDPEENPLKSDSSSSFFSGRLNDYIAIGGDFRNQYEVVRAPDGAEDSESFREDKQNIYLEIDLIPERVIFYQLLEGGGDAREVVGLFKGELYEEPYYVKAGKFYLPYGLRLQDDSAYVRSVLGFTYGATDQGIEFGYEPGPWALHVASTNGTGSGASPDNNSSKRVTASAAYVKKNFRLGASYSQNKVSEDLEVKIYGVHAGAQFGRVGLLFEADVKKDEDKNAKDVEQFVSILELNFLIARGKNLKLSYEYHDPDKDIFENAKERYSLVYEPFLNQFVQVRGGVRDNEGIPQDPSLNTTSYFLELHLYF